MHFTAKPTKFILAIYLLVFSACNLPVENKMTTVSPITWATQTQPPQITNQAIPTVKPTHTPLPVCNEKIGTIEQSEIADPLLAKPMRYKVYLPPCYYFPANASRKYPVIFLLHGQYYLEDQWIRIGAIDAADKLIGDKSLPPFIMVFPFDYSIKQPNQYQFEKVFIEKLVPLIDATYKVLPGRDNHAIGGVSRGGAWALHLGIRNSAVFGAIGGHSPVIFFADHKGLPATLFSLPAADIPRLWLDIGNSDPELDLMKQFEQDLTDNQIPHTWNVFPGYHEERYWSAHVNEYLTWYAQNWPGR